MESQLNKLDEGLCLVSAVYVILNALTALETDDAPALVVTLNILTKALEDMRAAIEELRAIDEVKAMANGEGC